MVGLYSSLHYTCLSKMAKTHRKLLGVCYPSYQIVAPRMLNKFVFRECEPFHEENKEKILSLFALCIHHPFVHK